MVALVAAAHERGLARLASQSRAVRNRQRRRRAWFFYAGLAVLLLAVASPIDYWADDYFFVHMVQHVILMFFAPMLIVVGAPWLPLVHAVPAAARRLVRRAVLGAWAGPLRALGRFLGNGTVAVVVFNVVIVLWHLPGPFDLGQDNRLVHIWLMHGSFFVAGVAFWLQIFPSYPMKPKLSALGKIGAILGTDVVISLMAMAMGILSLHSWYPAYAHLAGVRLSPFIDQQIGAGILWVSGFFWALPALIWVVHAVAEEGSAEALVDRFFRRPTWAVDGKRTGADPSR